MCIYEFFYTESSLVQNAAVAATANSIDDTKCSLTKIEMERKKKNGEKKESLIMAIYHLRMDNLSIAYAY